MNIILFDGTCNLCNRTILFITRRDPTSKFSYVPLQSETGKSLLQQIGLPPVPTDTIVYIQGTKHFVRSAAILNILKELGGYWKLLYAFILIPPFIRDPLYRLVARTRYRIFGKTPYCHLPPSGPDT